MPGFEVVRVRRYAAGLALAAALIAANAAFNLAAPVAPAILPLFDLDRGRLHHYRAAIRDETADTFLLGSSRAVRGHDLCGQPGIIRVAVSGWRLDDVATITLDLLAQRTRPATIIAEIGIPEADPEDRPAGHLHRAISPAQTLRTLDLLVSRPPTRSELRASCRPSPISTTERAWLNARRPGFGRDLPDAAAVARGFDRIERFIRDANALCRRQRLRHRLRFFAAPLTSDVQAAARSDRALRTSAVRLTALFANASASGGCEFDFRDLRAAPPGGIGPWRDPRNWSDAVHYKPVLGKVALAAMLEPPAEAHPR